MLAELVDASDLKFDGISREGSNPLHPTILVVSVRVRLRAPTIEGNTMFDPKYEEKEDTCSVCKALDCKMESYKRLLTRAKESNAFNITVSIRKQLAASIRKKKKHIEYQH